MQSKHSLIYGFSKNETEKIEAHLERLLPYIDTKRIVIVGGLAIRYHIVTSGGIYPKRQFNDLDIIAENIDAISPKIKKDFLIYHYHPPKIDNSFYLVLVDPISKTKIDIFDYSIPPEKTIPVQFGPYSLQMQSVEDQLVKTILDIQRISLEKKVDPKQFLDTQLLMQIADLKQADIIWKRKNFTDFPDVITNAMKRAETIANKHPEWLQEKPFRKNQSYICLDCISTAAFPIAPMENILKILGYVE